MKCNINISVEWNGTIPEKYHTQLMCDAMVKITDMVSGGDTSGFLIGEYKAKPKSKCYVSVSGTWSLKIEL